MQYDKQEYKLRENHDILIVATNGYGSGFVTLFQGGGLRLKWKGTWDASPPRDALLHLGRR